MYLGVQGLFESNSAIYVGVYFWTSGSQFWVAESQFWASANRVSVFVERICPLVVENLRIEVDFNPL